MGIDASLKTFVANLLRKHADATPADLQELAKALRSEASRIEKLAKAKAGQQ